MSAVELTMSQVLKTLQTCPHLAGCMLLQVIEHTLGWMRKRPGQQVFRARFSAISGPEINAAMVRIWCLRCVFRHAVCLSVSTEALMWLCEGGLRKAQQLVKLCPCMCFSASAMCDILYRHCFCLKTSACWSTHSQAAFRASVHAGVTCCLLSLPLLLPPVTWRWHQVNSWFKGVLGKPPTRTPFNKHSQLSFIPSWHRR